MLYNRARAIGPRLECESRMRCQCITAFLLLLLTAVVQALDFTYTNTNGTITITGYTGPGGNVTIPSTIDGLPVTSVGDYAFYVSTSIAKVTIPNGVTNIGDNAFNGSSLAGVTLGNNVTTIGSYSFGFCYGLTNVILPDSVTCIKDGAGWVGGAFGFCESLTNVTFGKGLTNIGVYAFVECHSLTKVVIPKSVAQIGSYAFQACAVTNIYFQGNAPSLGQDAFLSDTNTTVFYLPAATGWTSTFGGLRTVLWNPQVQTNDASFGVRQNHLGFNITGTPDIPIVVEASTSLAAPSWVPLQSCTLTNGLIYFSDPQWTNYPGRFYRIRSP